MNTLSRNKKHFGPIQAVDGIPHSLAHGAEQTANRLAGAVEVGGARVAKMRLGGARVAKMRRPQLPRPRMSRRADVVLKTQLAKTSRELANESADLSAAISSLNAIVKKNRRAKARTRLFGGLAIGALVMYHLDPDHGRERRAAAARMLTGGAGQTTLNQP